MSCRTGRSRTGSRRRPRRPARGGRRGRPSRHAHGHQHRRPSGRTPVGSQRLSGSWSGSRPQWRCVSRWRSTQLEWSSCAVTAANSAALQAGKPRSCGTGGVGDDLREGDLRRRRREHGARRRAQAGARARPGRVEVTSGAVEGEHVDVGALAVDDLLHAQGVARVQGEALPGARGHERVAARGRVAGRRRPSCRPRLGAGRIGRSRRLVGDRDGDERAEPVRRVRAREHLVDDDPLLVVQAQDELHQATAGAGRSVPVLSAWTATPTSIPAAATRKTPLGPWAPAIAPPAAAPTAMPTVSPAVCRL